MKCVVDKADLQTYRVTDRDAAHKTASGRFVLVNKETWKLQGRKH